MTEDYISRSRACQAEAELCIHQAQRRLKRAEKRIAKKLMTSPPADELQDYLEIVLKVRRTAGKALFSLEQAHEHHSESLVILNVFVCMCERADVSQSEVKAFAKHVQALHARNKKNKEMYFASREKLEEIDKKSGMRYRIIKRALKRLSDECPDIHST